MSDDRRSLGARLREAREYLGFSQDEVARATGVARPAVSLWRVVNARSTL